MREERLRAIADLVARAYSDIVRACDIVGGPTRPKLRVSLADDSFVDIQFDQLGGYSYHWQRVDSSYRFNNYPAHHGVPTYPHRLHNGVDDRITAGPVRGVTDEDVRRVMDFIRAHL